ncbi:MULTISPECIES: ABC transporter substrate-binding protein [unclassified Pseudofrankia]|uniref:ABC transporter substrate-binding protein n=1 Tax=unclassified Pseudofrankia TaxID=2994372 RepID=UPI000A82AA87|nr:MULTISPECIES: extracellular solute-binding protein [unclassified Pseudofrankia]MDT3444388.1 extracellular solute-binding protein [Pseudofrankia sp. BMG5.37]
MARSRLRRCLLRSLPAAVAVVALVSACGGGSGDASGQPGAAQSGAASSAPVSPQWQAVIDAAKKEGSVTLYSAQGTDQLQDLAKRFQKAYGIKVDVLRITDAPAEAKLDAEHGSNAIADVVTITDSAYVKAKGEAGWFTKPTGPSFTNDTYDTTANMTPSGSFVTSAAVFALSWNTQSVPNGLKSYKDLLDPKLKGKIGVPDPAASPSVVDFYFYLQEQNGAAFVDDVLKSKPQIFPSVLPLAQSLTSGQISAALATQALTDEKKNGAPVDYLIPKPAWGARFYSSIVAKAPHPNAAQLLANFYISQEGQEAIAYKAASIMRNIPGSVAYVADVRVPDLTKLTPTAVADFRAHFKALTSG